MLRRTMHRISYANVVATVALFLALGGTSVAATNLINGKNIKRGSVPADRVKAHSLTGTQVDVTKLGTVPAAAHAGSADSAGHADAASHADASGHADSASHADSADLLGGKPASAFMPAGRLQVGAGDPESKTPLTLLSYPDLGLQVETDGDPDYDTSVVVRNTGATQLGLLAASGAFFLQPGKTALEDAAYSPLTAGSHELRFFVQSGKTPTDVVLVECVFPGAGIGSFESFCRGTRD
jgi:hypothetical protein